MRRIGSLWSYYYPVGSQANITQYTPPTPLYLIFPLSFNIIFQYTPTSLYLIFPLSFNSIFQYTPIIPSYHIFQHYFSICTLLLYHIFQCYLSIKWIYVTHPFISYLSIIFEHYLSIYTYHHLISYLSISSFISYVLYHQHADDWLYSLFHWTRDLYFWIFQSELASPPENATFWAEIMILAYKVVYFLVR